MCRARTCSFSVFHTKKTEIKRELDEYDVLDIAGSSPRRGNQRYLLSTLEVGVVVLGCVVFVGALVTALCVTCVRRNKRYDIQCLICANVPFFTMLRRNWASHLKLKYFRND